MWSNSCASQSFVKSTLRKCFAAANYRQFAAAALDTEVIRDRICAYTEQRGACGVHLQRSGPRSVGSGNGRSARRASGLLARDYKGKDADVLVTRTNPGVVSLVGELRGHQRQAAQELGQEKTGVEERKPPDALPAPVTLAMISDRHPTSAGRRYPPPTRKSSRGRRGTPPVVNFFANPDSTTVDGKPDSSASFLRRQRASSANQWQETSWRAAMCIYGNK